MPRSGDRAPQPEGRAALHHQSEPADRVVIATWTYGPRGMFQGAPPVRLMLLSLSTTQAAGEIVTKGDVNTEVGSEQACPRNAWRQIGSVNKTSRQIDEGCVGGRSEQSIDACCMHAFLVYSCGVGICAFHRASMLTDLNV